MADQTSTALALPATSPVAAAANASVAFAHRAGLDLGYVQAQLQTQTTNVEDQIRAVQANENLSDTERMFEMQMLMNTWSTITSLRTNVMKTVSDSLKSITRNVA